MANDDQQNSGSEGSQNSAKGPSLPAVSAPKGGGAIRGIGEKFAANPAVGTGSVSVPLAVSPGRSGFGPQLSLAYDSGSGNGPFGYGWHLSLPQITRKTDKGLPRYQDALESDEYIFAGAEDLVPMLDGAGARHEDAASHPGFLIHRYVPRVESAFVRIERWTNQVTGDIHWRSITRDNATSLFGTTASSRIADPNDPLRVFTWLIAESYDQSGNAIRYTYVPENADKVDRTLANEKNRVRTANRYVKRIHYGNRAPRLPGEDLTLRNDWLFEVVFDYAEGHVEEIPLNPAVPVVEQHRSARAASAAELPWALRPDSFSSYRGGFEVRTSRRCTRVLMFHRFDELGVEPCLVRSTELDYEDLDYSLPTTIDAELAHQGSSRFASFLRGATHCGFVRDANVPVLVRNGVHFLTYLKKSAPRLEFEYSKAIIQDDIRELDPESLKNLPAGVEGAGYRWVDLDGEGVSGVLSQQTGAWFYKPNLGDGRFGPVETLPVQPSLGGLSSGQQQLLDLAGDGTLDLVSFAGAVPGFYERTDDKGWAPFQSLAQVPAVQWNDPNLRFVDLNGDGHADVLITEHQVFTQYPSLGEEGFGPSTKVRMSTDEEKGPRLVFADGTSSIYLADMCGDGLTDLVRVRNGEVCYWPNVGYGRFGPKVTMDNAPWFDRVDQFSQVRIRLADIDGSGTTDIIYLGPDAVDIYFNQSGNRLSERRTLSQFPPLDSIATITTADLLGNGTACLVWSSPQPAAPRRTVRYIDLMGGNKPHLLIATRNNLGAETRVRYVSSTRFYLADKAAGRPWITKLPFPVHVVERVEIYDRISRNRFVTRHAYHHGFFDGLEREFRGFGMVEQWDTEEFGALSAASPMSAGDNIDESSAVPPVWTKTWFHTGVYVRRGRVSDYFAGLLDADDVGEYYREPGLTEAQVRAALLSDTEIPDGLSTEEEHEACRALKGAMLRQEVYALDGSAKQPHPYSVKEQNFTIETRQRRGINRHAVFFTHARESLSYLYERNPADPRVIHELTLEVDPFGNVLKRATVSYGRRQADFSLAPADRAKQAETLATYTENAFTNAIDDPDDYRTPAPAETRLHELTGLRALASGARYTFDEMLAASAGAATLGFEQMPGAGHRKRVIEHTRTYYRRNDLTASLPLGQQQSLALPFESYTLAFTPGLVANAYAGRVTSAMLADDGGYTHTEADANWWAPTGRMFFSPGPADTPAQELAFARAHFFLPHRFRDPFHTTATSTETFAAYDAYNLLILETRDAFGNRVTAGERNAANAIVTPGNNYRVLQPELVMDPNRNRTAIAFDALGRVVGTAVMGKPGAAEGDRLTADFAADLTEAEILDHLANPLAAPQAILRRATTRVVYDLFGYERTKALPRPQPSTAYTLARETHDADPVPAGGLRIQHTFAYSDGFGREIQRKVQAEPGVVPTRDANGSIVIGADGQAVMTANAVAPRWTGTGWTVFNNKAKPVRQYEPYFTDTHRFEFDVRIGVSRVLFYDPLVRVVATLQPDHTWLKTVLDAWRQDTWDASDTVLVVDPATDPDVGEFFARLPAAEYLPTWYTRRIGGALGAEEQAAAQQAAIHANTPTVVHADALGRTLLTVAHNRFKYTNQPAADPPAEEFYRTRTILDIKGNRLEVIDAKDRVVMRYDYDVRGTRIRKASMEAGERWTLTDCSGKPIDVWDSFNRRVQTTYDASRRPREVRLHDGGARPVVSHTTYGEGVANAEDSNLRARAVEIRDQAGILTTDLFDFKGNLLRAQRQFAQVYNATLDWSAAVPTGAPFVTLTAYDALNRALELTTPDGSVVRRTYNEANLVNQVDVRLLGAWTPFVTNVEYDAKGQRTQLDFSNAVTRRFTYDPVTFRLIRLETVRDPVVFPDDCPQRAVPGWRGCRVQDLRYTYDPTGNPTNIRDDAQQRLYFQNRRVDPNASYRYDAVARLIEATGREHLGQVAAPPTPYSYNDVPRVGVRLSANDGTAVGRYLERYLYDEASNLTDMAHVGATSASAGWTRTYDYEEPSLLEPMKASNRLTRTTVGATVENYSVSGDGYDSHGNMLRFPHLAPIQWDFRDQLQSTRRQAVNAADADGLAHAGELIWYVYDVDGRRVRKVTERNGVVVKERLYVGAFELFVDNGPSPLVRETLHVSDGDQRLALVETRTDTPAPQRQIRYQFGNHLGSSSLELDDQARILSYEEYSPYGSTTLQAVSNLLEAPKRYRFTSQERDEESGLGYHGARYCVPWLGRWLNTDPIGIGDGTNLYEYCRDNPVRLVDRTGSDGEEGQSSGWDRFLGGLKMVGGALETTAGAGLVAAGAATGWTGVGIGVAAAGVAVTAHGADTTVSGARTMWNGRPVDTFTSQGLQGLGMTRTAANLTDAGISIVGTLGANVATRAPALATVASTEGVASVSVSHAAGAPSALGITNPLGYAVGHARVGVDVGEGAGTVWSHLTVPNATEMMASGQLVRSGEAVVSVASTAPKFASVATVQVSAAEARAAQSLVTSSVGSAGEYGFLANDCTTYASSVLNAAGVPASGATPAALFVSTALRSEAPVTTLLTSATVMQPVTTASMAVNATVGAGQFATSPSHGRTTTTSTSAAGPTRVSTRATSSTDSGIPDPSNFHSFDEFQASVSGAPYTQDYLMQRWAAVHGWVSGN
jgi:RHS repeat-associated protein